MTRGFAIRSDARIDEYDPDHVVDLRADGTLHVLDADRAVARSYATARWTVLAVPVTLSPR